jgi:TolA-binding protein
VTSFRTRAARVLSMGLLVALLPGCVYYNTLYLAKRYYQRSLDDVPYALDKEDLSQTQQFARAIDLSRKVIAQYPKSKYVDDATLLWAKSLINTDDPRQAIVVLEDFDTRLPKSPVLAEATFYLGVAYLRARKYEPALRTFDAYLVKHPKHNLVPYAYFEKSRALLALDRPAEAAASVGQVIERFPRSRLAVRARIARAQALMAQKSFDAAREDYRYLGRHALTDDDRLEYLLDESDCLVGAGKFGEAMTLLRSAIAHAREPARADTSRGAPVAPPSGPGVNDYGRLQIRIGNVHMRQGRLDEALAAYRRVIEDYPRSVLAGEAQYRIGYAYETVGDDFERARQEYAAVRDQGPGSTFAEQATSRVASLDRLAQYRKAGGDTLSRAAEGDFLLAEQYLFELEKPDRALEQYRKIEQSYAGTPWAAKALTAQGWVLARRLKQPKAADSLFWKVVREHPGTEAQLAARDYLEQDGVEVPSELIKLPKPVFTHADTVAAESAAAETVTVLSPIPQGPIPLGMPAPPGSADSLRLGPRQPSFSIPPVAPHNGAGEGGAADSLRSRGGASSPAPTGTAPPRDTTRTPAPADTTRRPAPPDSAHVTAPKKTTGSKD